MLNNVPQALLRADNLLQAGKTREAQQLLVTFIQQNPNSELGWYMLSHVTTQDKYKIECLKRVLAINPSNREAQTDLSRLTRPAAPYAIDPEFLRGSPFSIEPDDVTRIEAGESRTLFQSISPLVTTRANDGYQKPSAVPVSATSPEPRSDQKATGFQAPVQDNPNPLASSWDVVPSSLEPGANPDPKAKVEHGNSVVQTFLICLIIILAGILVIGGVTLYLGYPAAGQNGIAAAAGETETPAITNTPSIILTPTFTLEPTLTPRPSETFIPPGPTLDAAMETIQKQVSSLRGLPIKAPVNSNMMTSDRVKELLQANLNTSDSQAELQTQARVLAAFGLIKPTYDLFQNTMNHTVDGLGGFYIPGQKQIIVLGLAFNGLERFVYSHEYDHALVDQNFDLEKVSGGNHCVFDTQRCEAVNALVEGDAQLLMYQWLAKYATPKDYQQLVAYTQPAEALPEVSPPPFTIRDLSFPYDYGMLFVKALYDKGKWPAVNHAYQNLPLSTAQIIHPAKYLTGVKPIPVAFPSFENQLGPDWKLINSNILGEWDTYLILGYGVDAASRVNDKTAASASAGWGGDYYQVYYDESTGQSIVVVNWMWDSPDSAINFQHAMDTHLGKLYKGAVLKRSDGDCWELNNSQANSQATCLFTQNSQSLWIVSPTQDLLDLLKKQFSDFATAQP